MMPKYLVRPDGGKTMNFWLSAIASVGHLGLALLVVRKAWRTPLGFPLTLLCIDIFTWNTANLLFQLTDVRLYHLLDVVASPLTVPLALHVVMAFVGRLRPLRFLLVAIYLAFSALSLAAIGEFALRGSVSIMPHAAWSIAFLAGIVPSMGLAVGLLILHLERTPAPDEQARTRLMLASVAVGTVFGSTELLNNFVERIPSLGHVGSLAAIALLILATLRFRLVGRRLRRTHTMYALSLAAAGFVGVLVSARALTENIGFLLVATGVVMLALVVATRELVTSLVERTARTAELANLGRFSAQMAHDIKNPLAAIKGAAQYLEAELGKQTSLDDHEEFVRLLSKQADRMRDIVDNYSRMSRIQPVLAPVDLNELLPQLAPTSAGVRWQLAPEPVVANADADLLKLVVENLLSNALQAMPSGGQLTVATARAGEDWVQFSVADEGTGMDARQLERAFDDFYTTKAAGSGMGLAFVRRVIDAHDGSIELRSVLDEGTEAVVHLRSASDQDNHG